MHAPDNRILGTVLLGAVTGAAVALLYAPANGHQTRQYLRDKAREGRDGATRAVRNGQAAMRRTRDRFRKRTDEAERLAVPQS